MSLSNRDEHHHQFTYMKEKYAHHLLSTQEWLTEIDIQQLLANSGMDKKIAIARLDEQDLQGAVASLCQMNADRPYVIPLILNDGKKSFDSGPHFISAIINIDPLTKKTYYKVEDNLPLSEERKKQIQLWIEKAIRDNNLGQLDVENCEITSHKRKNTYINNYKMLHELYRHPMMQASLESDEAKSFANVPANDSEMIKFVYTLLLRQPISIDEFNKLSTQLKDEYESFNNGYKLKDNIINDVVSNLKLNNFEIEEIDPTDAFVQEKIMTYNHTVKELTLYDSNDISLKQAASYFFGLGSKLKENNNQVLDQFSCPGSLAILQSLNAYLSHNPPLFKNLVIDIQSFTQQDKLKWMISLKSLLSTLSSKDFESLSIRDPSKLLSQEDWNEIKSYIVNRKISVPIHVVAEMQDDLQDEIDDAISNNKREKRIVNSIFSINVGPASQEENVIARKIIRPVRKRVKKKAIQGSVSADVELQQEQELGQQHTMEMSKVVEKEDYAEEKLKVISYTDFTKFKTMIGFDLPTVHFNWQKAWNNIFGNIKTVTFIENGKEITKDITQLDLMPENIIDRPSTVESHNIDGFLRGMTRQAAEELLTRGVMQLESGLDIWHLPPGFEVIIYPKGSDQRILHYDSKKINQSIGDDLALKFIDLPKLQPLSPLVFDQCIAFLRAEQDKDPRYKFLLSQWESLRVSNRRQVDALFRAYLPRLLEFDYDNLKGIFEAALDKGVLNKDNFEFVLGENNQESQYVKPLFVNLLGSNQRVLDLFNNLDKKLNFTGRNITALIQLYDGYGEDAVASLLSAWNELEISDLHLVFDLVKNSNSFVPLCDKRYYATLSAINGLKGNEKQWWQSLLKQHISHTGYDDISNLFTSFRAFIIKVEHKKLSLYPLPGNSFSTVKNMVVDMGHMLAILNHCENGFLKEQWEVISQISLRPNESLRALTDKGRKRCRIVLPEMQIDASTYNDIHGYASPWSMDANILSKMRHAIFVPIRKGETVDKKSIVKDKNDGMSCNISGFEKEFYRYLASQEYRLPLSFYQSAFKLFNQNYPNIDKFNQINLLILLANITTGEINHPYLRSEKESFNEWQELLNRLTNFNDFGLLAPIVNKLDVLYKVTSHIEDLSAPAPLPILLDLTQFIVEVIKKHYLSLSGIHKLAQSSDERNNGATLIVFYEQLNLLIKSYKESLYNGLKFYNFKDPELIELGFNFLNRHLSTADYIHNFNDLDVGVKKSFLGLISTFNLVNTIQEPSSAKDAKNKFFILKNDANQENPAQIQVEISLKNVLTMISNMRQYGDVVLAFELLSKMEKNNLNGNVLTIDNLIDFLLHLQNKLQSIKEVTQENIKTAIIDMVQEKFSPYYSEDFFKKLRQKSIPVVLKNQIELLFDAELQPVVINILNTFDYVIDEQKIQEVLKLLDRIIQNTDQGKKKQFLDALASQNLLVNDNKKISIDEFIALLNIIVKRNQVNDFIYFVLHPDIKLPNVDGLAEKVSMYLGTILPTLEANKQKSSVKTDVSHSAMMVLLSSNEASLKQSLDIKKDSLFSSLMENIDKFLKDYRLEDVSKLSNDDFVGICQLIRSKIDIYYEDYPQLKENTEIKNLYNFLCSADMEKLYEAEMMGIGKDYGVKKYTQVLTEPNIEKTIEKTGSKPKPTVSMNRILSVFKRNQPQASNKAAEKSDELEIPTQQSGLDTALKGNFYGLVEQAKRGLETNRIEKEQRLFSNVFVDLFGNLNQFVDRYPLAKSVILRFFENARDNAIVKDRNSALIKLSDTLYALNSIFKTPDQIDQVLSLLYRYGYEKGEFIPSRFIDLLNDDNFSTLSLNDKKSILKMMSVLLNTEKNYTEDELKQVLQLCHGEKGSLVLSNLEYFYSSPPYPTLRQVIDWHIQNAAKDDASYIQDTRASYTNYDLVPAPRDNDNNENNNGFILEKAQKQIKKFEHVVVSDEELEQLDNYAKGFKTATTSQLLEEYKKFKNVSPVDYQKLVPLCAELLYRSKAKDDGKRGSSFEIHTTQYLAIYTLLKTGHHVTSEIGTGEGKSRIMMVASACQLAQGKTVDFATSDAQLAIREYLDYQTYFQMLGAKTSLIYADSPINEYKIGGINFSDPANLSLFRNKARAYGQGAKVIDPNPILRALMLDEGDKVFFDIPDRFNYSTQANKLILNMEWVYPLLIEFYINLPEDIKDTDDMNLLIDTFKGFIKPKCSLEQVAKIDALSDSQIASWIDATEQALDLRWKTDFDLGEDTIDIPGKGKTPISVALLKSGGRVAKQSKYSFGVHQCLHARLNYLRKHPDGSDLSQYIINNLSDDFHIESEKQIIYQSNTKIFLDDYKYGSMHASTGTGGSDIEQLEAATLYSGPDGDGMKFIKVPRHKGLLRQDHPVRITANHQRQVKALAAYIKEARAKGRPVLLFCKDDEASDRLLSELTAILGTDNVQQVHGNLTSEEEKERVSKAGQPGMLTISTKIIGRGTDIFIDDRTKEQGGLRVLVSYLPRKRELEQMIARGGRFGDPGDSRVVLDAEELKTQFSKEDLKELYLSLEHTIQYEQTKMDMREQKVRLIGMTISDFNRELNENFFNNFYLSVQEDQRDIIMPPWLEFMAKKDKAWNIIKMEILEKLSEPNIDLDAIDTLLGNYRNEVNGWWEELRRDINFLKISSSLTSSSVDEHPVKNLRNGVGELKLSTFARELMQRDIDSLVKPTITVYSHYDPAHDGFAVVYDRPFVKLLATLRGERKWFADFRAWRNGEGLLFPNFQAWWKGNLKFSEFLFSVARPPQDTTTSKELTPKKPSTPAHIRRSLEQNGGGANDREFVNGQDVPKHKPSEDNQNIGTQKNTQPPPSPPEEQPPTPPSQRGLPRG